MRLQKEEKIVVVLLLMALTNLAVANWALSDSPNDESAAFSSTNSGGAKSDQIVVEGAIKSITPTKTGGHLILRINSTKAQIFVSRDCGARDLEKRLSPGQLLRISGRRALYNGEEEIKVQRAEDIEILRP